MTKYCSNASLLTVCPTGRNSATWKRLLKVRAQAQPHIRWTVGRGKIYFWDDIWLDKVDLRGLSLDERGDPKAMVEDFIRNGVRDEPKLQLLHAQAGLPQRAITQILDTPIGSGEPDIPRWNLIRLGDFSLATAWETIRTQRPIIRGLDDICKVGLSPSISIFIWRLLSNRIPVDTKLQWRIMELASKCQCCPRRPGTESLQHLFIQGSGATSVWREFDAGFEGATPPIRINDTIPDRLEVWSRRIQQPSKTHLSHVMSYLILWFLWAERNRSRHQMVQFKPFNVVWQVQTYVRNSMANGSTKPKHWKGVKLKMNIPIEVEPRLPRPLAMLIKRQPRNWPWIKVNPDGAYVEATDRARGGGIIRDSAGKMIIVFATPLNGHSALEAKLKAIHLGLTVAMEFNQPIWIESDSEQALRLLNGASRGPAHTRMKLHV
ncbi:uncharacterized protein LOC121776047 [Salvia splendens]|uniref:uncharacterized protein LOC121776047 n=1 Tax=Salvia splendens TaxID=180675 RepID=UPI001C27F913|nr:uncharacterized protein LOC121776047 [Salvia splendens]